MFLTCEFLKVIVSFEIVLVKQIRVFVAQNIFESVYTNEALASTIMAVCIGWKGLGNAKR